MKKDIIHILRQNPGQFISGEELSANLHVSRTAIWKHIKTLKCMGYAIEAHTRLGYRLLNVPDLLLPHEIRSSLTTQFLASEIHYCAETDSTNIQARKLALDGCPDGTIIVAESQGQGRGRMARGWFSPFAKGIWCSIILRPKFKPYEAPKATLMAAVAIQQAIKKLTKTDCGIKWPNDILYDGKKLVGILTEVNADMDNINYLIIGFGVNVNIKPEDFPPELQQSATSVNAFAAVKVSRIDLLSRILGELENLYHIANQEGFTEILQGWRKRSITIGRMVDVYEHNGMYSGKAIDIDSDGALLVDCGPEIKRVLAGDVSIRARSC